MPCLLAPLKSARRQARRSRSRSCCSVALAHANTGNAESTTAGTSGIRQAGAGESPATKLSSLADAIARTSPTRSKRNIEKLRKLPPTRPDAHRDLARWCRKQHLTDEEQLHWRLWLRRHPGDAEAIKALRLKNYRGLLLTNEQIEEAKKEQEKLDAAARQWMPELKKLKHAIDHGDATSVKPLSSSSARSTTRAAIPSLEEVFGVENRHRRRARRDDRQNARRRCDSRSLARFAVAIAQRSTCEASASEYSAGSARTKRTCRCSSRTSRRRSKWESRRPSFRAGKNTSKSNGSNTRTNYRLACSIRFDFAANTNRPT